MYLRGDRVPMRSMYVRNDRVWIVDGARDHHGHRLVRVWSRQQQAFDVVFQSQLSTSPY